MNRMLKIFTRSMILFFSITTFSYAQQVNIAGNVVVHIPHRHYINPTRLVHPYLDIWHMKGPPAEKAATELLSQRFANVSTCGSSEQADVVLLLEPHMFYNAQMRVFHAEFIAKAFLNDGAPITTIKQQTSYNGELNIAPEYFMSRAYEKAMDKIVKALEEDEAFIKSLDKGKQVATKALCNTLDELPLSKVYY